MKTFEQYYNIVTGRKLSDRQAYDPELPWVGMTGSEAQYWAAHYQLYVLSEQSKLIK